VCRALVVVDLDKFRQEAAGDALRQHYQKLAAQPNSLHNMDQDLVNSLQNRLPVHQLSSEWLWCESWCGLEAKSRAKIIDLVYYSHYDCLIGDGICIVHESAPTRGQAHQRPAGH
jgi:hypothetical protein